MKRKHDEEKIQDLFHSTNRHEVIWFFLGLSLLSLAFESTLALYSIRGDLSVFDALWLHLGLVMGTALFIPLFAYFSCDIRMLACLPIFCLTLGPLGALACVCIALFYLVYRHLTTPFLGLLEQMFPEEGYIHPVAALSQRMERGLENVDADTTAIPFLDVMKFGTLTQKIRAVGLSLRYFHPKLAPVLKTGLRDGNNSVRVLSATSLLALDNNFYETFQELKKEAESNPEKRMAWLALAKHAETYAESHVLSDERAYRMLTASHDAYERYATLVGMTDSIKLSLARLDLRLGNLELARTSLENLASRNPPNAEALKLLWELRFRCGEFQRLREMASSTPSSVIGPEMDKEIVSNLSRFWSSGESIHAH